MYTFREEGNGPVVTEVAATVSLGMTTSHEGFPAGDAGEGRSPLRRFRPCAGMTRIRFDGPTSQISAVVSQPLPGRPSDTRLTLGIVRLAVK